MPDYICHDFKTPRTDTSKRLPNSFKAVPLAFYLSLLAGAYFMTMDWIAYKRAQKEKITADATRKEHEDAAAQSKTQKAMLDAETAKAEAVAKWIEGARNIQPLSVAIARAVPPEVTLSDLTLERSDQVPANLNFTMRLQGGSATEVGIIENSLSRLNYKSYSPEQTKDGSIIEYRSTLVRTE